MKGEIAVGLLGLGVVGSSIAQFLQEKAETITRQAASPVTLKKVLVRHPEKPRPVTLPPELLTTHPQDILTDPTLDIVIEVIGGEQPATDFIRQALSRGKHVITANKEVMAKYGAELLDLAATHRVGLRYEASVGAGIPLIATFQEDLLANKVTALHAIINGTTNYILTKMSQEGLDFTVALKQAQELGYAESDPTKDIEGIDAAQKLAILATLAFHTRVRPEDVFHEGISRLTARDFRYARELGYAIRLLAIAKEENGAVQARVHPVFIPGDWLLAKVEGVFNAVQIEGDLVGRVIFYGQGAGAKPTTSAILADLIALARHINLGINRNFRPHLDPTKVIKPMANIETRYYLRMNVADRPGVLAQIARVLGDRAISIASVIQKEADEKAQTAEIVIMTHPSREAHLQEALQEVARLPVVKEVGNFVRVEG